MFFLDKLVSHSDCLTILRIWVFDVAILKASFATELDNWVKNTECILA